MPVPHHSVFTGWMPFLPPSQQRTIWTSIVLSSWSTGHLWERTMVPLCWLPTLRRQYPIFIRYHTELLWIFCIYVKCFASFRYSNEYARFSVTIKRQKLRDVRCPTKKSTTKHTTEMPTSFWSPGSNRQSWPSIRHISGARTPDKHHHSK